MFKTSLMILTLLIAMDKGVAAAPTVSVTKFTDKSGVSSCRYNWDWWSRYLGDGFKEVLINELAKSSKVEVLERETIRDIYADEHELVNSEEDKSLKKGKFKKAKYSFAGAVTEFEFCAQKNKTNFNVGGLARLAGLDAPDMEVGFKGAKAKVGIMLRVIDNQTGRVVKSIQVTEAVEDSGFNIDTEYGGHSEEKNSPADKAARLAIEKAARQSLEYI